MSNKLVPPIRKMVPTFACAPAELPEHSEGTLDRPSICLLEFGVLGEGQLPLLRKGHCLTEGSSKSRVFLGLQASLQAAQGHTSSLLLHPCLKDACDSAAHGQSICCVMARLLPASGTALH